MREITARIERDSISPEGKRLTTFICQIPRFILAELNTHRALSRNAASSRAIPLAKYRERVAKDPFIPKVFGKNGKGMQSWEPLPEDLQEKARNTWLHSLSRALTCHIWMEDFAVHKQWANRLLEPFMWVDWIVSATEWSNFFTLRTHPDAQPEFVDLALKMYEVYSHSGPQWLRIGEWHLPFVTHDAQFDASQNIERLKQISAARCCRVSYLTQDGQHDPEADIRLFNRLVKEVPRHISPLEHIATPYPNCYGFSNFKGWKQFRQEIPDQTVYSFTQEDYERNKATFESRWKGGE